MSTSEVGVKRESLVDPFESFKAEQKVRWACFAPLEVHTTPAAAELVRHARIQPRQRVLDVACGTGVVAITAARIGARTTGLDLTPALLEHARENARIAEVCVEWLEGDVEKLPFADASFDAVLSQFGHIFAPRADLALSEMLRVLKSGGTLAFSTWPPELLHGRLMTLSARYVPPPADISSPAQWGDPTIVRQSMGTKVKDIVFERKTMLISALSPQHQRENNERNGRMKALITSLESSDPEGLAVFRHEYTALVSEYFHENMVSSGYLMTRAIKV